MRTSLLLLSLVGLWACSYEKPDAAASTAATGPAPVPADSLTSSPASPVTPARVVPPDSSAPTAAAGAEAPAGTAADWPAAFQPDAATLCTQKAASQVVIYQRPSASAPKFGQLAAGETVKLTARTADGWVGFDPATAQAANVGLLRLRWVRAAEAFGSATACAQLPVVSLPTGCLLMAAEPVAVRAQPQTGAATLSTIPAGSYAQVEGKHTGWLRVTVPGRREPGFVPVSAASVNGPCQ